MVRLYSVHGELLLTQCRGRIAILRVSPHLLWFSMDEPGRACADLVMHTCRVMLACIIPQIVDALGAARS